MTENQKTGPDHSILEIRNPVNHMQNKCFFFILLYVIAYMLRQSRRKCPPFCNHCFWSNLSVHDSNHEIQNTLIYRRNGIIDHHPRNGLPWCDFEFTWPRRSEIRYEYSVLVLIYGNQLSIRRNHNSYIHIYYRIWIIDLPYSADPGISPAKVLVEEFGHNYDCWASFLLNDSTSILHWQTHT